MLPTFSIIGCAISLASLFAHATPQEGFLPDSLNPRKAHVWLELVKPDENGSFTPRVPNLRLYGRPDLSGPPLILLNARGLTIQSQLVCEWPGGRYVTDNAVLGWMVLKSAEHEAGKVQNDCPADLPIRSYRHDPQAFLFIEITRLDGPLVEVRYHGVPYYFSLRSLNRGYEIFLPSTAPPLLGVVDIPRIFRPPAVKERKPIVLRRDPRIESPIVASISSADDFEVVRLSGGAGAGAVYARTNRWTKLRLIDGRTAWLAPAEAGKFASLERVLSNFPDQTSMTEYWDRTLAKASDSSERISVPHDPRRAWVGYLEPNGPASLVPVFAEPDRSKPAIGQFQSYDDTANTSLENVYIPGLGPRDQSHNRVMVFSHRPGWFEVALGGEPYENERTKRAWIEDTRSVWSLHEVADPLEAERLLRSAWGDEEPLAVMIKESKRVRGVLWLHVDVLLGGPCLGLSDQERVVLAEGWVAFQDTQGRALVRFETYCD